jgi:hypothetical protein
MSDHCNRPFGAAVLDAIAAPDEIVYIFNSQALQPALDSW